MSEEVKEAKVSPEAAESVVSQESAERVDHQQDDSTKQRLLRESSNWKAKARGYEQELEALRLDKMQAEGRKDELIESLKSKNAELSSQLHQTVGNFAKGKALDVITDEAVKIGCTSPRLLKKMVEEELEALSFDDSFNPDKEQVKLMLDRLRKEEPVLFSKAAPKTTEHNINANPLAAPKTKTLKDMKDDDLLKAFGNTLK